MDKNKVGQFLKLLREQKGKTQYQVAMGLSEYGIEVSDKTVAKWEKGNFPDMDKLAVIAEFYGVKVTDILNGEVYKPQDFEKKYFIVNNAWMNTCPREELYCTRVTQERLIKATVKELLMELIENKSLTAMQNDELNFLLDRFYSISAYAMQSNENLANDDGINLKVLRREIYCQILSMHDSSADEIYWEIKKLFYYNKRATFRRDIRGYEANIPATEEILMNLEDWEKDLLLAQIQTQNIADFYDKLTYFKLYGIDYDEERITKEGIKLLIKCGAKLNSSLLGYMQHRYERFSILDRMETLHAIMLPYIDFKKAKNVNLNTLQTTMKRLFPEHHSHELRHTFISRCKESGVSGEVVSIWAGHSLTGTITTTVYTHYSDEFYLKEAEKVDYLQMDFNT